MLLRSGKLLEHDFDDEKRKNLLILVRRKCAPICLTMGRDAIHQLNSPQRAASVRHSSVEAA